MSRSLDRSCFFCTLPTCCSSSNAIISHLVDMQTIPRFMDTVSRLLLTGSHSSSPSICIDEVSAWMKANRLLLNHAKTEVLWCASSRRQHPIPTESVRVGDVSVSPVTAVRDLGVYMDADVSMRTQVTNTARVCFSALHQIHSV